MINSLTISSYGLAASIQSISTLTSKCEFFICVKLSSSWPASNVLEGSTVEGGHVEQ